MSRPAHKTSRPLSYNHGEEVVFKLDENKAFNYQKSTEKNWARKTDILDDKEIEVEMGHKADNNTTIAGEERYVGKKELSGTRYERHKHNLVNCHELIEMSNETLQTNYRSRTNIETDTVTAYDEECNDGDENCTMIKEDKNTRIREKAKRFVSKVKSVLKGSNVKTQTITVTNESLEVIFNSWKERVENFKKGFEINEKSKSEATKKNKGLAKKTKQAAKGSIENKYKSVIILKIFTTARLKVLLELYWNETCESRKVDKENKKREYGGEKKYLIFDRGRKLAKIPIVHVIVKTIKRIPMHKMKSGYKERILKIEWISENSKRCSKNNKESRYLLLYKLNVLVFDPRGY
ncbi:4496_t:CDS:2 [Dentiscutata erythropus]|uniref:4496_t:CDS:1 n=1 Tax=Dentiscutata erythropus TaxID=1348616 RepID=A0A9N9DTR8_9GLOM|nr:4496_t:CDS:2 [Dentiscutata erythropus]